MTIIDENVRIACRELFGKKCCRKRVGSWRSLSIGFGEKIPHSKPKTVDPFYGEWEIGTYSSAWRIIRDEQVLCGSKNLVDSDEELDHQLQDLQLGIFVDIESLSPFDIRIKLERGIFIDFIAVSTDDDEMFHIFGPENLYVDYRLIDGWTVGKANVPWIPKSADS